MFPKSLSFSKKQTMYYDQHTARWILLEKKNKKKQNSACVVIYLKLYNCY